MIIKRTRSISGLAFAILAVASMSIRADEMRGDRHDGRMRDGEGHDGGMRIERHEGGMRGGEWHGPRGPWHADFRHFDRHDYRLWRRGGWRQSWHDGRFGWWWIAGGEWFFYPQPVYPYPDPYAYAPTQTIVVQLPPQPLAPQPVQQLWYFCDAANGYYVSPKYCFCTIHVTKSGLTVIFLQEMMGWNSSDPLPI